MKAKYYLSTMVVGLFLAFATLNAAGIKVEKIFENWDKVIISPIVTGTNVTSLKMGMAMSELKSLVKAIPDQKVNSQLTVKNLSLYKVFKEGNDLGVIVNGLAKYKKGVSMDIDFRVRFIATVDQNSKKIKIHKYKLNKAEMKKGIPGMSVTSIGKEILKSFAKDKVVKADKFFNRLSALDMTYSGVDLSDKNYMFFLTSLKTPRPYDAKMKSALEKLQAGDIDGAKAAYQ